MHSLICGSAATSQWKYRHKWAAHIQKLCGIPLKQSCLLLLCSQCRYARYASAHAANNGIHCATSPVMNIQAHHTHPFAQHLYFLCLQTQVSKTGTSIKKKRGHCAAFKCICALLCALDLELSYMTVTVCNGSNNDNHNSHADLHIHVGSGPSILNSLLFSCALLAAVSCRTYTLLWFKLLCSRTNHTIKYKEDCPIGLTLVTKGTTSTLVDVEIWYTRCMHANASSGASMPRMHMGS